MNLKTIKISTGVDKNVMSNISRFIKHSEGTLKNSINVGKKVGRKRPRK